MHQHLRVSAPDEADLYRWLVPGIWPACMPERVAIRLRRSQETAIGPPDLREVVLRAHSKADSVSEPHFDASADHRVDIFAPRVAAEDKRAELVGGPGG